MNSKKLMALLLAVTMLLSMVACSNGADTPSEPAATNTQEVTPGTTEADVVEEKGVSFPLEEEYTFDLMVKNGSGDAIAMLEKCAFWQDLYEATNVKVNVIALPATETMNSLNGMFTARTEGDAIFSNFISDTDLILMASNNLLLPLNEYIDDADLMPNFNERVLADNANTKGAISAPDGSIYALPMYNAQIGNYLESPMWINKTWIDQLGMEIPTTMEELEAVLTAFAENDMNGNGVDDEVPYLVLNGNWQSHLEAFLGHFGMPTKDGTTEHYIFLENGKVQFGPTSENYKDAIKLLNRWYENGLIWQECFTGTNETYNAKLTSEVPVVGMYTGAGAPNNNYEDYVQLAPVAVEGYETRWYVHPGSIAIKGRFALTRSCEDPEIIMAWIDQFYDFANSIRINYGEEADGRWVMEDGKVVLLTITDQVELDRLKSEAPTLKECITGDIPSAFNSVDYAEKIDLSKSSVAVRDENYAIYSDYLNEEIWPRPYLSEDVVSRLNELRTDIFNTVNMKRAAWISGDSDIDAEWDAYVESMKKMGVEDFVSILQDAYDSYIAAQK